MKIINLLKKIIYTEKIYIYSIELRRKPENTISKMPVWFGHASLDEIKILNSNPQMDLKVYQWKYLKNKIENNIWDCVVAKFNGEIIGYGFYSANEMIFSGTKKVGFKLPTSSVYFFRFFVHPDYRNYSIGTELMKFWAQTIKSLGADLALSAVQSSNKIQIHNKEKLGWKFIGSVIFIKTKFFNIAISSFRLIFAGLKRCSL